MSTEAILEQHDNATESAHSLLEQAIGATKQTDASRAEELLRT